MPKLDREKYLTIAQTQGFSAAITALHAEMEKIEWDSFEGKKGWNPEQYAELETFRKFSRELWDLELAQKP